MCYASYRKATNLVKVEYEEMPSTLVYNNPLSTIWAWGYQHLYIVSDKAAEENEYALFDGGLGRFGVGKYKDLTHVKFSVTPLAIIATTDKSLSIHWNEQDHKSLPLIPEGFVKKYVELQGIDEVMVDIEYDEIATKFFRGKIRVFEAQATIITKIKIDKNNYITISKVKDTWTREELEQALGNYGVDVALAIADRQPIPSYKEWIENNL